MSMNLIKFHLANDLLKTIQEYGVAREQQRVSLNADSNLALADGELVSQLYQKCVELIERLANDG